MAKEKRPEATVLEVSLPKDTSGVPLLYANGLVVNFTGNEFLLTVIAAIPEPWTAGHIADTKVTARVLGRFAVATHHWLQIAKSIDEQIDQLRAQGLFDRVPGPPEIEA